MTKTNNWRVIGFVAVLVALVAAFGGFVQAPVTGYAIASECQGSPVLTLSPNPAKTGEVVTASVSGLTGCAGRIMDLRKDNCFGPVLDRVKCYDSECASLGQLKYYATGDYQVAACLDKNKNGYLYDPGERAASVLTVVDLPDLAITDLYLPDKIRARVPFQAIATVENLGTSQFNFANIFFDLYKTVATADKYYGTTSTKEVLVLTWPESAADSASTKSQFYVSLPAGGKQEVLMRALDLTPGDYRLVVRADWKSIYKTTFTAVEEFSKDNNQLERRFTVT